jgi:hypothetical protein
MAAHAPWGAGNDLPQALPGGKKIPDFLHFILPAEADYYGNFFLIQTWDLLDFFVWY